MASKVDSLRLRSKALHPPRTCDTARPTCRVSSPAEVASLCSSWLCWANTLNLWRKDSMSPMRGCAAKACSHPSIGVCVAGQQKCIRLCKTQSRHATESRSNDPPHSTKGAWNARSDGSHPHMASGQRDQKQISDMHSSRRSPLRQDE